MWNGEERRDAVWKSRGSSTLILNLDSHHNHNVEIILRAYTLFNLILTIFSRGDISIYILLAEESGIQRS